MHMRTVAVDLVISVLFFLVHVRTSVLRLPTGSCSVPLHLGPGA